MITVEQAANKKGKTERKQHVESGHLCWLDDLSSSCFQNFRKTFSSLASSDWRLSMLIPFPRSRLVAPGAGLRLPLLQNEEFCYQRAEWDVQCMKRVWCYCFTINLWHEFKYERQKEWSWCASVPASGWPSSHEDTQHGALFLCCGVNVQSLLYKSSVVVFIILFIEVLYILIRTALHVSAVISDNTSRPAGMNLEKRLTPCCSDHVERACHVQHVHTYFHHVMSQNFISYFEASQNCVDGCLLDWCNCWKDACLPSV